MRALLVGELYPIVSDPVQVQELLDFVKKYQFTELTFYTGGPLATRVIPNKEPEFNDLLAKVNAAGITNINIAVGSIAEIDRVVKFANTYHPKFTGYHIEFEFWNHSPRDVDTSISLIKYLRLNGGTGKKIGVYIGWTTQAEMTALVPLVDRLFIHAYVPDGNKTFGKVKGRLDQIMAAKPTKKVSVYPIFSAEWLPPEICNQGTSNPSFYDQMCFMGPWLKTNGGPAGAETAFNKIEAAGRTTADNWRNYAAISGFFYYSYTNLRNALK